jgi:hypothetical protein
MPAAIVTGAVGLYSAHQQRKGAKEGAQAQTDASNAAIGEARQNLSPYMDFGQSAIPLLQQLNQGDYSGFLNSPDYLAARDLGQGQIDHSAAARGGLFGGGHTRDTMKFGSQLGAQYLGQYRNSLLNQLGGGQNAASTLTNAVTGQMNNIGDARQSAYQSQADTNTQLAGGLAGMFNNQYQRNQANNPGGTPWYFGNRPGQG